MKKIKYLQGFKVIYMPFQESPGAVVPENSGLKMVVNRQVKKAVQRNRIKRVLREFFRLHRESFSGWQMTCIARPEVVHIKNENLFKELRTLL